MRYRFHVLIVMIAALLVFSAGCGTNAVDKEGETPAAAPATGATATSTLPATPAGTPPDPDDLFPEFSVPMVGGGTFKLSEKRGKPVFVNFFATWCGSCEYEMPDIERVYKELGDKIDFVIIAIGEDEATVQTFLDRTKFSVPFAYSPDGKPVPGYQIDFLPQTYVLDANGAIAEYFPGPSDYEAFRAAVEKAMGQ